MTAWSKIFIIGMPGSGKSTIGHLLADQLGKSYFDLDHEIEKKENLSIASIFKNSGESEFRLLEDKIFRELNSSQSTFVMSTGGGTPCFFDNINLMKESGVVIYLEAGLDILAGRTKGNSNRPLLKDDHASSLASLYAKRKSCYSQANFTINIDNKTEEDIVGEIVILLE